MPYTDPVAQQAYNREYKRRNRWRYASRQKVYDAAKHANSRAAAAGVPGVITPEDAEDILSAGKCFYCGTESPSYTFSLDHRVPMSAGGRNDRGNLVCACHSCNARKRRGDAPGGWSDAHACCVTCGGTDRPHSSGGHCQRCWQRDYRARLRGGAS